jgi:uncharacterized protein (TIRG00374 family)
VIAYQKTVRYFYILGKFAISIGAVLYLLNRIDISQAFEIISRCDRRFLIAGVLLALLVPVCLAARFVAVLRKGGIRARFLTSLQITWIGQFWNFFLPGSTGGDLYRLAYVWKLRPQDRAQGFFAIFSDRVLATSLLLPVAAIGIFVLAPSELPEFTRPRWLDYLALTVASTIILLLILATVFWRMIAGRVHTLWTVIQRKFSSASQYFTPDSGLLAVLGWAALAHLVNFAVFFCFAQSLGLNISYMQVVMILPAIIILLMIPVSINGHGVREVLFIFFLSAMGVTYHEGYEAKLPETVLALSVVGLSVDLFCNLPGGLIFVFSREVNPAEVTVEVAR